MSWEQYYKEKSLSLERYINNIWDHKLFLIEVASSGRNTLEVATGSVTCPPKRSPVIMLVK